MAELGWGFIGAGEIAEDFAIGMCICTHVNINVHVYMCTHVNINMHVYMRTCQH